MSQSSESPPAKPKRLVSLDVYRGLIMVSLAFNGFGLARTASNHLDDNPDSGFWALVKHQFSHVEWLGCSYWDLIQPSFMFMVGMSMAYSYVRRQREGQSYRRMLGHAFFRSVILVVLGILLTQKNWLSEWWLTNVLAQIGLGYTFLFLLWGRSVRVQAVTAGLILVGVWALFITYPNSGVNLETGAPEVGVSAEWAQEHLPGVAPAWHKNANVAHDFDVWFFNAVPREPFVANRGGYQTLNFIPSIVTMLFGLMCGELLRSRFSDGQRMMWLIAGGIAGIALGLLVQALGISPIVKRIWTPAWTLFSTGWCCLILATIYWVVDMKKWQSWTMPFVIVGMNSIAIYCMSMILTDPGKWVLDRLFGSWLFTIAGENNAPFFLYSSLGLIYWIVCWVMYRRKWFLRI